MIIRQAEMAYMATAIWSALWRRYVASTRRLARHQTLE
jgi:hypothetical protein